MNLRDESIRIPSLTQRNTRLERGRDISQSTTTTRVAAFSDTAKREFGTLDDAFCKIESIFWSRLSKLHVIDHEKPKKPPEQRLVMHSCSNAICLGCVYIWRHR
jgi:hypothetical protein